MRDRRLERTWARLLDSQRWRRFRATPLGRGMFDGRAFGALDLRRRRLLARLSATRHPQRFAAVDTVCLFIGHVKSGGTLTGAMIDAHPDALIADEVDVLEHLDAGFHRSELMAVLAKSSRREAMKGRVTARRLDPYSLAIPGRWQGRHRSVRVIGVSRAGPTTRRLGSDPGLLADLVAFAAPARLRFVHVVRNPLDPIAAMVLRGRRSIEEAAADYDLQASRADRLRSSLEPGSVHTLYYEALAADPVAEIESVVDFLGLDPDPGHVEACRALMDTGRPGERHLVEWSSAHLEAVGEIVRAHPFLDRYQDAIDVDAEPTRTQA